MQIMMTGFLGKTKAKLFLGELWNSLIEAQNSPHGIPKEMIEMKRTEMVKKKEEDQRINASLHKSRDEIERSLSIRDKQAAQNRKEYQSSVLQRYSPPPPSRSSDQRERRPSSRERKETRKKSISPPPPPPPAAVAPSSRKKSLSPSRRNRNDVDDYDIFFEKSARKSLSTLNNHLLLNDRNFLLRPGVIKVEIHPPVETLGMTNEDVPVLRERVFEMIQNPILAHYGIDAPQ
jgi:hypothetical protein